MNEGGYKSQSGGETGASTPTVQGLAVVQINKPDCSWDTQGAETLARSVADCC